MGILDSVKLMFGDPLLDEVIAAHGLTRRLPEGSLRRPSRAIKRWPAKI